MEKITQKIYTYLVENESSSLNLEDLFNEFDINERKWSLIILEDLRRRKVILSNFSYDINILSIKETTQILSPNIKLTEHGRSYIKSLLFNKGEVGNLICFIYSDSLLDIPHIINDGLSNHLSIPIFFLDLKKDISILNSSFITDKIDIICWVINSNLLEDYKSLNLKRSLKIASITQVGFYFEDCDWENILSNILVNDESPFLNIRLKEQQLIWEHLCKMLESSITPEYLRLDSQAKRLINKCLGNKEIVMLDLGNCGLNDNNIDEQLDNLDRCKHIEELILSNEWGEFDNGKWKRFESKNSGKRNFLSNIPEQVRSLKKLRSLKCGGDWNSYENNLKWQIRNISPILELKNLVYLNLSNNEIEHIDGINKLSKLEILHLNNNYIGNIKDLASLEYLKELYLSNNKIKNTAPLKKLKNINTIDLHTNEIKDLTPIKLLINRIGISNSKWKPNCINIFQNNLSTPPVWIIENGNEAVNRYFKNLNKNDPYINKDIKIILAGNSEVGKSTLVKYIQNNLNSKNYFTHWLEVIEVENHRFNSDSSLRIFDFGGHDYYHDTHNMFFSTNAIYIVLWTKESNHLNTRNLEQDNFNGRKFNVTTQDYPLKYWLDSIKFYTKEKQSNNFGFEKEKPKGYSSVSLLIQNKVLGKHEIEYLNNKDFIENYPFIYDFLNIDILHGRNLSHFDDIFTEILQNTKIVGEKFPKYYGIIKDRIHSYDGKPILTFSEFESYCNEVLDSELDEDDLNDLAEYLYHIGIIIYKARIPLIDGTIYIDKKRVIEQIHLILLGLTQTNGEFDHNHIINSVSTTNSNLIDSVIELMLEFKIIFLNKSTLKYIAPLYLPATPSKGIRLFLDHCNKPFRRFQYQGFIYKSIILSIFDKYKEKILREDDSSSYYWKNGLVIKDDISNEIILIKFNLGDINGNAFIDLVKPDGLKSSKFIDNVIDSIKQINKEYNSVLEMVTLNGEDFIPLEIVYQNEDKGNNAFFFNQKYYLLKDFKEYLKQPPLMKKIFISYSKTDLKHLQELEKHFSLLKRNGFISTWNCNELVPGAKWDGKIKKELQEADIILFLVSSDFWATDYIWDYEIKAALDRDMDESDNVIVIPIIVRSCDWEDSPLSKFNSAPKKGMVINLANDIDAAWTEAIKDLKRIIFSKYLIDN